MRWVSRIPEIDGSKRMEILSRYEVNAGLSGTFHVDIIISGCQTPAEKIEHSAMKNNVKKMGIARNTPMSDSRFPELSLRRRCSETR